MQAQLRESAKELFKDDQGRAIPGYLTTSELIAEIDAEPVGTDRYKSLAAEAIRRAHWRAFPRNRVPALLPFASFAGSEVLIGGIVGAEIPDIPNSENVSGK